MSRMLSRLSYELVLYTSGRRSPPLIAIKSASRICGTTCSGVTKLMLWQPALCSLSMIAASCGAVTSVPSPCWLVSKFWQKTHRRLHHAKKIVPDPFQPRRQILLAEVCERACHARKPSAFAYTGLVFQSVYLAIARADVTAAQQLKRLFYFLAQPS